MRKVTSGLIFGLLLVCLIQGVYAQNANATVQNQTGAGTEQTALSAGEAQFLQSFENIGRLLFAIPASEKVDVSYLVVLFALFILLFFVVTNIMSFVPFFTGWKGAIAGVAVCILASVSGGLRESALLFLGFKDIFGAGSRIGKVWFMFVIVLFFLIAYILIKVLDKLKKTFEIEKAENLGLKSATNPVTMKLKEKGIIK